MRHMGKRQGTRARGVAGFLGLRLPKLLLLLLPLLLLRSSESVLELRCIGIDWTVGADSCPRSKNTPSSHLSQRQEHTSTFCACDCEFNWAPATAGGGKGSTSAAGAVSAPKFA